MHGLQILKRTRQVSTQQVQAYQGLPVANISDCMARMTVVGDAEKKTLEDIAAGRLDTSWIDATLKRIGCDPEPR